MDTNEDGETAAPVFEDALRGAGESHEVAPSEYTGARQIKAPAVSSTAVEEEGIYNLPPAGTYADEDKLLLDSVVSDAGSTPLHEPPGASGADVNLQTPEEALDALRELARSADSPSSFSRPSLLDEPAAAEPIRAESDSSSTTEGSDADDVFAELRRMAAASGETEAEAQEDEGEEPIHLPMAPEGVSAFDRLMESPTPSTGVGGPRLDRRLQPEGQTEDATPLPTAESEGVVEQDAPAEVEATHEDTTATEPLEVTAEHQDEAQPVAAEPEAEAVAEEETPEDVEEKVVSFPGPQPAAAGEGDGRRPGRMAKVRGAASGLFDSGIHEEFMVVDLSELARDASGQPATTFTVGLDEALKAPAQPSQVEPTQVLHPQVSSGVDWPVATDVLAIAPSAAATLPQPAPEVSDYPIGVPVRPSLAPAALTYVAPHCELAPVRGDDHVSAAIPVRDVDGHAEFVVNWSCEPITRSIEPHLPLGLARSMGVVPPNPGQLIRSELFIKEPEVRECPVEAREAPPETDVRRVYYGRQGTA